MTTMQKEVRDRWTAALRSGEYEQGTGQLKTGSGQFCCLGVLCDVVGVDLEGPTGTDAPYEKWGNAPGLAYAPEVLKGLTSYNDRHVLSSMNDEGKSFAEIADYIEQNVPVS